MNIDTMTVTDADMNRNDIPDVLQQPQLGLAPQGFASPVLYGAPVKTVTGVDGSPDVQVGIAHKGFAALVQYGAPVNIGTMTVT